MKKPHEYITAREKEVLELLAQGLGRAEIAERLKISHHTVRAHLASIFDKLGVHRQIEAVLAYNAAKNKEDDPCQASAV